MIYEIVIAALILIIVLFIIYFFFPIKQKGIPKEPAKRPIVKEEDPLVPYYSEGEVIVEDELYGMKMIWDSYEERVEKFIKYLETSTAVHDPKVISTFQDIEGDYEEIVSSLETRFTSGEPYDWDLFGELYAKMKWLKKTEADRAHVQELVLLDKRTDTRVSHRDVGIGVSQVLPVLVSAYAAHNQIVAIEQPEIHLHPSLQAELGDVFIESALSGSTNTFLLETHSEHLILRIMRRMRETVNGNLPDGMHSVAPDDVSILYVQPTKEGSIVRVLELDAEGQLLDPWPGGFFEEGFRERFA